MCLFKCTVCPEKDEEIKKLTEENRKLKEALEETFEMVKDGRSMVVSNKDWNMHEKYLEELLKEQPNAE